MCAKPLVGLNMDFRGPRNETPAFSWLCSGYYESVLRAGGIPVAIPLLEDPQDISHVLDTLDAFVMVGGDDLDPRRQGYERHSSVRIMDSRREIFDRMILRDISERRMPLLAIGAGMQLLNVMHGGSLYFNIEEDLQNAIPHVIKGTMLHRHALTVEPKSLMERIYGDGDVRVNSRHHQCVYEVANGFRATAHCPDGVIEAIESEDEDWFAVGTQFHPECITASALDMRIFEEFIASVTGSVQVSALFA